VSGGAVSAEKAGGTPLNRPVVGLTDTGTGSGYWLG